MMVTLRKLLSKSSLYLSLSAIVTVAIVLVTTSLATRALGLQVLPLQPRLGDAIVVNITPKPDRKNKAAPPMQVAAKTYPSFPISGNRFRSFLPTTPLEKPGVRRAKVEETTTDISVGDRRFPIQRITLDPGKSSNNATEMELKRMGELRALVTPQKLWNGKFVFPNQARRSSPYGVRRYYNGEFAKDYYHRGLDFAGRTGSPVTAPAPGRVALVGYEKQGFKVNGNVVGLDHGQGVITVYLHLSRIDVEEGEMLETGDAIGAIGNTGATAGPHLHWGLFVNGVGTDPMQWVSNAIE
jgi:murein DD-endopeptidase MepM/ murein hydrolase activator NlpD